MTTRIADIAFDPDVYASYMQENDPSMNAFLASGAMVTTPMLNQRAAGEANITTIPYWKDLDNSTENISSDDPTKFATPNKIDTGTMVARTVHINNLWETTNLAAEISATNPMQQIQSRTNNYWVNRMSDRLQSTQTGLYLANVGTDDMIIDISTEDGNSATDANKFNFDGFVDAYSTMGENANKLALISVHPEQMKAMRKENKIEFIQNSETGLSIPMYNGLRVIEDKKQPVIAGTTSGFRYVATIYAAGAFGLGEALAKRPVAVEYDEKACDGAGLETLAERKQWIIHPEGYKWTESSVAGLSPTVAECALAANWERQFDRENVALAWLVTNQIYYVPRMAPYWRLKMSDTQETLNKDGVPAGKMLSPKEYQQVKASIAAKAKAKKK